MTPTKQLDRPVHIGIDYGTSASKLVFRDYGAPGGERAYVVERSGSYRIPADVGATDSELVFGQSRDADHAAIHTWYESVKMRVAGEVMGDLNTFYRAPLTPLPRGFNAIDLAVLSVWTLIAAGADSAGKHLGAAASRMALAVTMGVPTSFYKSRELRNVFASITRRAYEMYRQSPASRFVVSCREARWLLDSAGEKIRRKGDLLEEEFPDWIRAEAMAALLWPLESPAFSEGRYALVDIGAGTTNVSIFRIVSIQAGGRWVKERIDLHSSTSRPTGMDAIDRLLASSSGLDIGRCLSCRGKEELLLNEQAPPGQL